ncbi:MAG: hypothetical protein ACW97P_10475 [Candidatus Hodarchaeales archaeon]
MTEIYDTRVFTIKEITEFSSRWQRSLVLPRDKEWETMNIVCQEMKIDKEQIINIETDTNCMRLTVTYKPNKLAWEY